MKTKAIISSLLLSILLISCSKQEKTLAFRLEEGKTYPMIQQTSVSVENFMKSVMEARYDYEVLEKLNDSTYSIRLHFKHIKLEMKTSSQQITLDSEKKMENPDPISKLLVSLAGKSFQFKMTHTGEMYDVEGLRDIYNEFYESSQIDPGSLSMMTQIVDQFFNEAAFKGNLRMLTSMFREESIRKGSEWISVDSFKSIYSNTVMTNSWKCKKITGSRIYIDGKSEMVRMDKQANSSSFLSFQDLQGSFNSESILDATSCWPIETIFNQELVATVKMKEPHAEEDEEHGHTHNPPFEMKTSIKTIIRSH